MNQRKHRNVLRRNRWLHLGVPALVILALAAVTLPAAARADETPSQPAASSTPSPSPAAQTATPAPASPKQTVAVVKEKSKPRIYVDEDYAFQVAAPEGWYRANPRYYTVAGELCRVWSPGSATTIMVYRYVDDVVHIPLTLLDQTAETMSSKLNSEILEQEIRTIGQKQATWLVTVGPGTGGAIDGTGNIRTLQHLVAIPRASDVIACMFVAPEEDAAKYRPAFEKLLRTLAVGGEQTEAQKNSR